MELRAVIFDMDGVIIDSHKISAKLITECAERQGVSLDEEDFLLWQSHSAREFWAQTIAKYNLSQSVQVFLDEYDSEEAIRRYRKMSPIDGVVELIDDLRANGVNTALVTSGWETRMHAVLDIFDLKHRFDVALSAKDVTHAKPDPQLFLLAAERMGVSSSECMVIEDSSTGVAAARSAGMKCIAYTGLTYVKQDVSAADHLCDDFHQLNFETITTLFT